MICANGDFLLARHWRRLSCAIDDGAYSKNHSAFGCAYGFFHRRAIGALAHAGSYLVQLIGTTSKDF